MKITTMARIGNQGHALTGIGPGFAWVSKRIWRDENGPLIEVSLYCNDKAPDAESAAYAARAVAGMWPTEDLVDATIAWDCHAYGHIVSQGRIFL